jgi:hypothetical protein
VLNDSFADSFSQRLIDRAKLKRGCFLILGIDCLPSFLDQSAKFRFGIDVSGSFFEALTMPLDDRWMNSQESLPKFD